MTDPPLSILLTTSELSTLHAEATARGTTTEALALKWLREKLGQSHAETSVIHPWAHPWAEDWLDPAMDVYDEPQSHERDELLNWLAEHPDVLTPYRGKWVAFDGRKIVAAAETFGDACDAAKANGVDDPFLVPSWNVEQIEEARGVV